MRQRDLATFLRVVVLSSALLEFALGSSANVRLAMYTRFSSHYTDPFFQLRNWCKIGRFLVRCTFVLGLYLLTNRVIALYM